MIFFKIKNRKAKIKKEVNGVKIINNSNKSCAIIVDLKKGKKNKVFDLLFYGDVIKGHSPNIKLIGTNRKVLLSKKINTTCVFEMQRKLNLVVLTVPKNTEFIMKKLEISSTRNMENFAGIEKYLQGDVLVISPLYPTDNNKYMAGFVHSRIKEYLKNGIRVCMIQSNGSNTFNYHYEIEGVKVLSLDYPTLGKVIEQNKFSKIFIHFMSRDYMKILDLCDYSKTEIYLVIHGPEVIYRDFEKITSQYLKPKHKISVNDVQNFEEMDNMLHKLNSIPSVKFIFVAKNQKIRAEKLTGINFNNWDLIPNYIDIKNFNNVKKSEDLRNNIFVIRKFDDVNSYSLDIVFRTIFELSKRPCFKNLKFNIYGEGELHSQLTSLVREFDNVKIHKCFLTHKEIAEKHKENGVFFIPSRYDSGAVSLNEGASSGLLVVGSNIPAYIEFLGKEYETLTDPEDFVAMADIIEKIHNKEINFNQIREEMSENVQKIGKYEMTLQKEINLIRAENKSGLKTNLGNLSKDVILTICINAYDSGRSLNRCLFSIVNSEFLGKVEIFILVDDIEANLNHILPDWISESNQDIISIKKVKKLGNETSISTALKDGKGKYLKIINGTDWLDTNSLNNEILLLENENVDLVLNDFSIYYKDVNNLSKETYYENLSLGIEYSMDVMANPFYGFKTKGPIIETSTLKMDMIKKAKILISQESIDNEFEFSEYIKSISKNTKYYGLNIYCKLEP